MTVRTHTVNRLAVVSFCLTTACSGARQPDGIPQPEGAARPEETWIAATCLPAAPDTTGWKVHQFADLELALPPDFTPRNRTTRRIEFVHLGTVLSLEVSTSPTRSLFFPAGRPALAKEEAGCSTSIGGYPAVIMARARANRFSVHVEWDGAPLWGADDWRKRLEVEMTTGIFGDAQRVRDALHTLRASEKR